MLLNPYVMDVSIYSPSIGMESRTRCLFHFSALYDSGESGEWVAVQKCYDRLCVIQRYNSFFIFPFLEV